MAQSQTTQPSTSKLLTKKKQAWVSQFKPTAAIQGTPLNYNAGVQAKYIKELNALVKQMTSQTERELKKFFKSQTAGEFFKADDGSAYAQDDTVSSQARIITNQLTFKFQKLFNKRSKRLAERMVNETDKTSTTALNESLKQLSGGLSIKTSMVTTPMIEVINASVVENVGLIRSIPKAYLAKVQGAVMRSITTGNGLQDLVPFLARQEGITVRHARNMALDQTRKAYNSINRSRMEKIGVKKFKWLHTGGSQKPRQLHIELSGQIFSFDNLPVIDENTGERGIPGQAINCGCRMVPVIEFDKGEPDAT